MFKKILFCLICLMLVSPVWADDMDDCFIQVKFYTMSDTGMIDWGGTSTGNCKSDIGMFYRGTSSLGGMYTGVRKSNPISLNPSVTGHSGGIHNNNAGIGFEAIYSLSVREVRGEHIIYGVVYCMNFDGEENIVSGKKTLLDKPIQFNEEEIIDVGQLLDGNSVAIGVTLMRTIPKVVDNGYPINVKTSIFLDGKPRETNGNGKSVLNKETRFSTSTGKIVDDKELHLKYIIDIRFDNMPEHLTEPFKTILNFKRTYWVDTDFYSEKKFQEEFMYSSSYAKDVELIPGEKIILVFPADTPSVHGFGFVDTVILRP